MTPIDFIAGLDWGDTDARTRLQAELCVLDLLGVAIGGRGTRLSGIICDHAAGQFGGRHPMLFDGRGTSAAGVALAGGMVIDSLDGHDGFNPAKGHIGCGALPAALACAMETGALGGTTFLTAVILGYELGARLGPALHATAPDYHTSGAWVSLACAAIGARYLRLDRGQIAHALGIAEYHGPRSQMMRCIDHPTMVKDGSGWGAMAGVSAALMARDGFTGAPAVTVGAPAGIWADLGTRWLIQEQYFKPYPVCRWAQGPIAGALALQRDHGFAAADVAAIEIHSFHEAKRLATAEPKNTEEAQYSTSFPVAVALARGGVGPDDIADAALSDPEILRLSRATEMFEDAEANAAFPEVRLARVAIRLRDGTRLETGWIEPQWSPNAPPTEAELRDKFRAWATPVIGAARADAIETAVNRLPSDGLAPLLPLITQPISARTV